MNAAHLSHLVCRFAAVPALLLAGSAQAASLCAAPPTPIDRRACEAARQGPEVLLQFVQRMNWIGHNLYYFDYVDEATQTAWDQRRREQRTAGAASSPLR